LLDDETLDTIEAIMALAQREALSELDVAHEGFRIRVVRGVPTAPQAPPEGPPEITSAQCVKSPLRGVFYRCPAPDAEPYVEVGQRVHSGQVVGLVEAMKVFNEVVSHVEGVVIAIPTQDGSLVEEGETLLLIEPEE
jgi:acetyl-CoA carboxylase biotin carboxyl carrier protein